MSFGVRVGATAARTPAPVPASLLSETFRRRYGESLAAELRSLQEENDPALLAEGLLAFGQRQERAGRLELAAEIYATVAGPTTSDDVTIAVGAVRERPLRIRAQQHLDAIIGRGSFGPRAEFLLRNLAQQASEPTTLLAMGAAGAVFRMTRLATLSRLAAAPNPGTLTQLIGAGRLASLAGFALEAPTFTLVGRLGAEALGRPQDWSGTALARDFASSYLVLGGLKLAGWGSGAAYRGIAGSAGAVRERPLQILFQQAGMFGGILLGHGLEQWTGLRQPQDGATTLVDSLAMLLQFNVAGRLSRHAFGPRVAAWERGLDARSELLARRPWRFPLNLGEPLGNEVFAGVAGAGHRPTLLELLPNQMLMSGNGNRPPRRRGSSITARFPAIIAPVEGGRSGPESPPPNPTSGPEPAAVSARGPILVETPAQLIRRIQDDTDLNFRDSLREYDLEFHIQAPTGGEAPVSRIERHVPGILQYLNAIAIGQAIPPGRRVVLVQEGEGMGRRRYSLIKGAEGFECHPPLARSGDTGEVSVRGLGSEPVAEVPAEPPSSPSVKIPVEAVEDAVRPAERSRTGELEAVKLSPEEEEGRSIPLRAQSTHNLARMLELSARQSKRRGIPGLILIETGQIRIEDLEALTLEAGAEIPEGSIFKVFAAESRRSFQATLEGERLRWETVEDKTWDHAAIFSTATVRSAVELYQVLQAYARAEVNPSSQELVLRFRGAAPSTDFLAEFVASTLDRVSLPGRDRLRIEFSTEENPLVFRLGAGGRWERE